jgi:uncharacterized protein (TIGR02145 family)
MINAANKKLKNMRPAETSMVVKRERERIRFIQSCLKKNLLRFNSVLFFFILFNGVNSFSQNSGVSINATGAQPNSKALLDIDATGMNPKAGVLIPRMTTAERNAITAPIPESLLIYNTDSHCFEAYYNGGWVAFGCLGGCHVPAAPTAGTNTPSATQIVWNWSDASSPVSYKWGTTSSYSSATNNGLSTGYTQTGLTCNTSYTLYVWAYDTCGNSAVTTLVQLTSACFKCGSTLTDVRDNKTYTTVLIGSQCWMAQNLNYGKYTLVANTPQISGLKFCQNLSGDADATCPMGGLYEWANMMNGSSSCNGTCTSGDGLCDGPGDQQECATPVQGLCPNGWHVPSHYEWSLLEQTVCAKSPPGNNCSTVFLYDTTTAGWLGTNEGASLKSTTSWATPNCCSTSCTGGTCNSSGFYALAGGYSSSSSFYDAGSYGDWWTATETSASCKWYRYIASNAATVNRACYTAKPDGMSVRCVKN